MAEQDQRPEQTESEPLRDRAANGSLASATFNDRGNVTGPDSPAGDELAQGPQGEGQGDDLANRLGGGEAESGALFGDRAASGDMRAGRSEPADAGDPSIGPSAGDVGGMGGVHGHTAGTGRPPGGMSPVQPDRDD